MRFGFLRTFLRNLFTGIHVYIGQLIFRSNSRFGLWAYFWLCLLCCFLSCLLSCCLFLLLVFNLGRVWRWLRCSSCKLCWLATVFLQLSNLVHKWELPLAIVWYVFNLDFDWSSLLSWNNCCVSLCSLFFFYLSCILCWCYILVLLWLLLIFIFRFMMMLRFLFFLLMRVLMLLFD